MHISILLQGLKLRYPHFNAGMVVGPCFLTRLIVSGDEISSQQSTFLIHLYGLISNTHFISLYSLDVLEETICQETNSSEDFRHKMTHYITSGLLLSTSFCLLVFITLCSDLISYTKQSS